MCGCVYSCLYLPKSLLMQITKRLPVVYFLTLHGRDKTLQLVPLWALCPVCWDQDAPRSEEVSHVRYFSKDYFSPPGAAVEYFNVQNNFSSYFVKEEFLI